jgi:F0F1-type ATP synthase epsilon subunit
MDIFNSAQDLRVVVRTPTKSVLDTSATDIEVEDTLGRFVITAQAEPALTALVPSEVVVRKRDGSEIHLSISWGSLVFVGNQVRIVAEQAKARYVEALRIAV